MDKKLLFNLNYGALLILFGAYKKFQCLKKKNKAWIHVEGLFFKYVIKILERFKHT